MFSRMYEREPGRHARRAGREWPAVLAVLLIAPARLLLAGPAGELDAGFGANGRVWLDDAPRYRLGVGHAIAEQPADGKLLLAGEAVWEGAFLVYRLNTDGSLDVDFGDGGSVEIHFDQIDASRWGEATAIAVQPDGRIVVGGRADGTYGTPDGNIVYKEDIGLARLNPDGTLDSGFGDNGRAVVDFGGTGEYLSDLLLLPDGNIVITGFTNAFGDYDAFFARLTPGGTLDASFGSGPLAGVTIVPSGGYDEQPQALVAHADGSLTGCGESSLAGNGTSPTMMSAAHVFANGSIDAGFGTGGLMRFDAGTNASTARDCVVLPDGTLLLGGYSGSAGSEDFQLAWLAPDGRLAMQYGDSGQLTLNLGGSESIQGMTSLADGSVAVTGLTGTVVNTLYADGWLTSPFPSMWPSEMLFAKFDPFSGQLDAAFGENGVTQVDFGRNSTTSWADGRSILQTRDGKLAAIGTVIDAFSSDFNGLYDANPDFAVAKIDLDGAGNSGLIGFVTARINTGGAFRVVAEVRRTGGSTGPVMVDYKTVPDTATSPDDYTEMSGTLSWNDGDTTVKSIEIAVRRVELRDGYFSLVLENPTTTLAASELTIQFKQPAFVPPPSYGSGAGQSRAWGGGGAFGIVDLLIVLGLAPWLGRDRRTRRSDL